MNRYMPKTFRHRPFLFHGTEERNLPSIKKHGLIPGYSKSKMPGGSDDDYGKYIWFDICPMTLYGWLCRYYALDVDWTIIAVPTKFLDIASVFKEKRNGHFYIYTKPIPPEFLYKMGTWKLVVEPLIKQAER